MLDVKTLKRCKIYQKYLCTVTGIALQPLKTHRQPRWHMKDNGHSYFFLAKYLSKYQVWFGGQIGMKFNNSSCNTFQMLKTCISLVHDYEDHIHFLSPGVL